MPRRTARRSWRAARSPCVEDFSGCDWVPKTLPRPTTAAKRLAVLARSPRTTACSRGRPRSSGRGRGSLDPAGPPAVPLPRVRPPRRPPPRRASGPRSSRCAGASAPGRRSARDAAGEQSEALGAAVLLGVLEEQLHAEARAEQRHSSRGALAQERPRGRRSRDRLHRGRERPDAGQEQPVGCAQLVVVARDRGPRAPTCASAFSTERRLPIP